MPRLDPIKAWPCTYDKCSNSFDTEEEMIHHKSNDPDHFYCKKCNVDCEDWVGLTQHKIEEMAPFLEGKMKNSKKKPKHIACEFCGMDFKSFGGRQKHRETTHRAKQSIACPGCSTLFVRAWLVVQHIENDQCKGPTAISGADLFRSIQQKYIVQEILKDPGHVSNPFPGSRQTLNTSHYSSLKLAGPESSTALTDFDSDSDTSRGDSDNEVTGGVALLDIDDPAQGSSFTRAKKYKENVTPGRGGQTWPALPVKGTSDLAAGLNKLSLDKVPSVKDRMLLGTNNRSLYSASGQKTQTDLLGDDDCSDAEESSICATEDINDVAHAWDNGKTASTLFPDAKATPADANALAIIERAESDRMKETNLLHNNIWDTTSDKFNPMNFYDKATGRYFCRFPSCKLDSWETIDELRIHCSSTHMIKSYNCPACLRRFDRPSQLLNHAENTNNCKIQQADEFRKLVDDITGGLLKAKQMVLPAIYRPGTDVVKYGKDSSGLMQTEFKAKKPMEIKW